MAVSDQFNVTATPDKQSYTTGDKVTVTIAGNDVRTESSSMHIVINLTAQDGATGQVTLDAPLTKVTPESVVITSVSDDGGHVWTVAANGLSASTTA